eukprot:5813934-Prymnesium_polylepis.1
MNVCVLWVVIEFDTRKVWLVRNLNDIGMRVHHRPGQLKQLWLCAVCVLTLPHERRRYPYTSPRRVHGVHYVDPGKAVSN